MALPLDFVQRLQRESPSGAWSAIFEHAWQVCSKPLEGGQALAEISRRDKAIGEIDLFLASAGWDLWRSYDISVTRAADTLAEWWSSQGPGRAVLILDALSLREAAWLLPEAKTRGFKIHRAGPSGAELPAETTQFAKALGVAQRSSFANDGAGSSHRFPGARTESADMAWADCAALIGSERDWVFWHHWPDRRLHEFDDPGKSLAAMVTEVSTHLSGDDFWSFVDRLATGRRVIVTSDHGYAACNLFPDTDDKEQTEFFKASFKQGRCDAQAGSTGSWVPPIALSLETRHGKYAYVNGRRKWKSAGGYPTLTHGGLTVLEVAVPFIELSK